MSSALDRVGEWGHEEVVLVHEPAAGLRAVIAIHDTRLGPAVGGTRMRQYASLDDAVVEALRLSRGMTYKAALAGVRRGGAKAVILGDPATGKSRALLTAYARVVQRLDGRFFTGGDAGIDARDVAVMARHTKYVTQHRPGSRLETAELAALGVYASIRATAHMLGRSLADMHVAVQGLGQVGYRVARRLREVEARVSAADVDVSRTERAASELGVEVVDADRIHAVEADVFSPNALGGVLNDRTIPELRCRAVVGGANEQLGEPRHAQAMHDREILYAPDYLVSAGGLLSVLFDDGEADEHGVLERVEEIGDTLEEVLQRSFDDGVPPLSVADELAEARLAERERRRGRR